MGKGIKYWLLIGSLLFCNDGLGYYYKAVVAGKVVDKRTKKRQLVVGLGDYHLKCHSANKLQRMYMDECLLKKCVQLKSKFVVEDLSSINNDGRMICCNFGINNTEGVLSKLADKARSMGIAVDNIEYRYCRVAGIGPLLNNLKSHPHAFRSSATIKIASLHKEIADEIEKIKNYDDGKLLNDCYKRATTAVHSALSKLGFNGQGTVADYCKQLQRKQYRHELEKLCIFDSALIDMNIMHAIAKYPEESLIFVIAGGSHIDQVSSMLKRMGYQILLNTSSCAFPALKKVLNSESNGGMADIHPEPIDLAIIDKFIQ